MSSFAPKSFVAINGVPHRIVRNLTGQGGRVEVENCFTGAETSFDSSDANIQQIEPTLKTHKIEFLQPEDRTIEDVEATDRVHAQIRGLEKGAEIQHGVIVPGANSDVGRKLRTVWDTHQRGYPPSATCAEWEGHKWIASVP